MNWESLFIRLRTAGMVLVLTLLAWGYAARQVETDYTFTATLKIIEPAGSKLLVDVPDGQDNSLTVTVRGTQRQIDQFADWLGDSRNELSYTIPPDALPGMRFELTTDLLRHIPEIHSRGLSVESVKPAEVKYLIDEYVTESLPVELPSLVSSRLNPQDVHISPPEVKVKLPRKLFELLKAEHPHVVVNVTEDKVKELSNRATGEAVYFKEQVQVKAPFDQRTQHQITIEPERVQVEFTVLRVPRDINGPVAVQFMGPRKLWDNYAVELEPDSRANLLTNLQVFVLPGQQADLSPNNVLAFVRLTTTDAEEVKQGPGPWREHEIQFVLPPGMRQAWDGPMKIKLRLVAKGGG